MSTNADHLAAAAARFRSETADHQMTVLHDAGLYRHVRFANPGSSFYWFDLITWPGNLAIKGDMGAYMFSREQDMFRFFRGTAAGQINHDYWAEKLPGGRDSAREYDEDVLRAQLAEPLAEHEREYPQLVARYQERKATFDATPHKERYPYSHRGMREPIEPKTIDEVREMIADYDDRGELGYESGARELLADLENADVLADTGEWNLRQYTVFYLWSCHAIRWGISQYDAAKTAAESEPVAVTR